MKKIMAICLAMIMALSMCTFTVMAEGLPTVTVQSVVEAVKKGSEIELDVSIANNPGFTNFEWKVNYDTNRLELKEFKSTFKAEIPGLGTFDVAYLSGFNVVSNISTAKIAAVNTDAFTNADATLFKVVFKVKDNAPSGYANVSIISDALANSGTAITVNCVAGGVKVDGIINNGWHEESGGFAYYIDGVKLTGIQEVEGCYYDFGFDGINDSRAPYTGFFEKAGNTYYVKNGSLIETVQQIVDNPVTCVKGGIVTYKCTSCSETHESEFLYPKGHNWDENYKCNICGTIGKDITNATIDFGTVENPRGSSSVPKYEQRSGGVRPSSFVSFDGKTALSKSNDANLNLDNYTMRDLYVSWTNDRGVGKAYINYRGRGDYYGEASLEYILLPASVKNFSAVTEVDSVTLTWDEAPGAGYYRIYMNGTSSTNKIGESTGTSYTVTGLDTEQAHTFYIASSAVSTDGENKVYNCSRWETVTTQAFNAEWTYGTDGGYYLGADSEKLGLIRFLFDAEINGAITESGIKYIKAENIIDSIGDATFCGESETGSASTFFGDIVNITEDKAENNYYAVAYIIVNGKTYWSAPQSVKPDFNKLIEY